MQIVCESGGVSIRGGLRSSQTLAPRMGLKVGSVDAQRLLVHVVYLFDLVYCCDMIACRRSICGFEGYLGGLGWLR